MYKNLLIRSTISWLPLAVATIMIYFSVYAVVQQSYRQNANDPQIQMAQDLVTQLNTGRSPASLISGTKVNIADSLAPFASVYTSDHKVFASGATLDGADPLPPTGTFESAKKEGQDWFSWQPKDNVRIAAVLVPYKDGYVLAGRSLKQVEYRESALEFDILVAMIGTLVTTFIAKLIVSYINYKRS